MRILEKIAREVYGDNYNEIIKSMDIIGDIAIVKIPEKLLDDRRFVFGEKILDEMRYLRVVLRQRTPVEGILRLRRFEYLAGEDRRETMYKEYGALYKLDVEKVYFTPRLSRERKRIMDLVEDGEVILNMFAGVGPYSILIAKNRDTKIHSIDINPYAVEYHLINNLLNKVTDKIIVYRGDSSEIILNYIDEEVDRVLMPLPDYAIEYLRYALKVIGKRGYIHIYLHINYDKDKQEAFEKASKITLENMKRYGYRVNELNVNKVREVSTRLLQVCVDLEVEKS